MEQILIRNLPDGTKAALRARSERHHRSVEAEARALLTESLTRDHVKPRLLGHWGTTPGLNFLYAHMNRAIKQRGVEAIYITGPGHGGPGLVANTYLEHTYTEVYPNITEDADARDYVMALGHLQAPVVVAGTDHWTGFRPDRIKDLGRAAA